MLLDRANSSNVPRQMSPTLEGPSCCSWAELIKLPFCPRHACFHVIHENVPGADLKAGEPGKEPSSPSPRSLHPSQEASIGTSPSFDLKPVRRTSHSESRALSAHQTAHLPRCVKCHHRYAVPSTCAPLEGAHLTPTPALSSLSVSSMLKSSHTPVLPSSH